MCVCVCVCMHAHVRVCVAYTQSSKETRLWGPVIDTTLRNYIQMHVTRSLSDLGQHQRRTVKTPCEDNNVNQIPNHP